MNQVLNVLIPMMIGVFIVGGAAYIYGVNTGEKLERAKGKHYAQLKIDELQGQANAWHLVFGALEQYTPGWLKLADTAQGAACDAIRLLAQHAPWRAAVKGEIGFLLDPEKAEVTEEQTVMSKFQVAGIKDPRLLGIQWRRVIRDRNAYIGEHSEEAQICMYCTHPFLDTGWECTACNYDNKPHYYLEKIG